MGFQGVETSWKMENEGKPGLAGDKTVSLSLRNPDMHAGWMRSQVVLKT